MSLYFFTNFMQTGKNQTQFRNNLAFLLKDRQMLDNNKMIINVNNIAL